MTRVCGSHSPAHTPTRTHVHTRGTPRSNNNVGDGNNGNFNVGNYNMGSRNRGSYNSVRGRLCFPRTPPLTSACVPRPAASRPMEPPRRCAFGT